MALTLLSHSLRRHLNPIGTRDLLVGAGVLAAAGGLIWWVMSDARADTPKVGPILPIDLVTPDKPGPRPEPVFPAGIETEILHVGTVIDKYGEPYSRFEEVTLGQISPDDKSIVIEPTSFPVDIVISMKTSPGDVLLGGSIIVSDVSFTSDTKLSGAELMDGKYGASPDLFFRINRPAISDTPNIRLMVWTSWKDGGTLRSSSDWLTITAI